LVYAHAHRGTPFLMSKYVCSPIRQQIAAVLADKPTLDSWVTQLYVSPDRFAIFAGTATDLIQRFGSASALFETAVNSKLYGQAVASWKARQKDAWHAVHQDAITADREAAKKKTRRDSVNDNKQKRRRIE
jgi:hypothetical protein